MKTLRTIGGTTLGIAVLVAGSIVLGSAVGTVFDLATGARAQTSTDPVQVIAQDWQAMVAMENHVFASIQAMSEQLAKAKKDLEDANKKIADLTAENAKLSGKPAAEAEKPKTP